MRSVRVRTTIAAVAVVGVAVVLGGLALVALLRDHLTEDVRSTARLRATDVASLLESDAVVQELAVNDDEELVIQVVDGTGAVVISSRNVAGEPPIADLEPGGSVETHTSVDDDRFLAVAVPAEVDGERVTVLVARTLELVDETVQTVTTYLVVGLPALLALVAITTWVVAGRALAPVDAIRAEVEAISATELDRRVPVPPTKDEIARLATTMNTMLERLEQTQGKQRRFVSDASHELRSPVASIRQHAEVALAHPEHTTVLRLGSAVLSEDLRMQRLVEDLLFLAQADEDTLTVRRESVDVDDIVLEEARRLRGSTSLRVDTSEVGAARIDGDPAAIRRVVRNIGENAARHARRAIALSLLEGDGSVVLRVDDDGSGIPPAERDRVFERFVRLDEARTRDSGGSGLGLAIVAEIAAAHHGRAVVDDSPLGGARIQLTFSRGSADG